MRFTLLTDPTQPSRVGNSISRDTCLDLAIIRGTGAVISSGPLVETFGNDHHIIATVLPLASLCRLEHKIHITNWAKFLKLRTPSSKVYGDA